MGIGRQAPTCTTSAALLGAAILLLIAAPANLCAEESGPPVKKPAPLRADDTPGTPEDYVRLEVREDDLLLTNVSDRPIVAWNVKHVVRNRDGNEGYTSIAQDYFRSPMFPAGYDKLFLPGESMTLEKSGEPWIREDYRDQGWHTFYEVGALVFEAGEAVGDPEIIERFFELRIDTARDALQALRVMARIEDGERGAVDELPETYRRNLDFYPTREESLTAIESSAWNDYRQALAHLRPRDLEGLPTPAEVLP